MTKESQIILCTLILHSWFDAPSCIMTLFQLGASVVFHKPLQRGPFHMQRSTDIVQKDRGGGREGGRLTDTISVLRADLAPTGLMTPDKPESRSSVENLTDTSYASLGWGEKVALFLLDEALTKQKVMTCEVVLTVAAAWLPNRAARRHSRGSILRAP